MAKATTTASSTAIRPSAFACPASSGACDPSEVRTKHSDITASSAQSVATSPAYFPAMNALRSTGFERIV